MFHQGFKLSLPSLLLFALDCTFDWLVIYFAARLLWSGNIDPRGFINTPSFSHQHVFENPATVFSLFRSNDSFGGVILCDRHIDFESVAWVMSTYMITWPVPLSKNFLKNENTWQKVLKISIKICTPVAFQRIQKLQWNGIWWSDSKFSNVEIMYLRLNQEQLQKVQLVSPRLWM